MSSYTIGYDEGYKCPYCNIFFNDIAMLKNNSWKCPDCKKYIHIAAPNLQSGYTLIRKLVTELKPYDSVHLPGSQDTYNVIAVDCKGKDKVYVALKGYGRLTFNHTDFVSVIDGGYYNYHWENNSSKL